MSAIAFFLSRALPFVACVLAAFPAAAWQVIGFEPAAVPVQQAIGGLLERFTEQDADQGIPGSRPEKHFWPSIPLPLESALSAQAGLPTVALPLGLISPVCVIGSGTLSRAWVNANRRRLQELGARCVLVAAQSGRDIETMIRTAHPVPVAALPFDGLAELHGIKGYPVLLVGGAP